VYVLASDLTHLFFLFVLTQLWKRNTVRTFLSVLVAQQGCEHRDYVLTNIFVSDFSMLWPKSERGAAHADVLNGISVAADPDVLYVTGKLWNRIFQIKLF
jgi:hypothetical protein